MNVPLIMDANDKSLFITSNSKLKVIDIPFKPYLITEEKNRDIYSNPIELIKIPDNKLVTMYKMEFNNLTDFSKAIRQLNVEKHKYHKLPYMEQLYVDHEDFAKSYPNTSELKIMYLDIEVLTIGNGVFPRANKSPIISIGCALNEGDVEIFDDYAVDNKKKEDLNILTSFFKYMKENDPDIIVTFNGTGFDLPYITTRAAICELNPEDMNRYRGSILDRDGNVRFRGRVHFDLYEPAKKDQSLFGIKSRGLKAVSEWYGYKAIKLEGLHGSSAGVENTRELLGTQALREYLTSDVEATRVVSQVYLPNVITLAEMMKVPLGTIVGCYSSFIPKLISGRHCQTLKLQPLDNNKSRYGEVDPKDGTILSNGRIHTLGGKYEGALVNIRRTGYFPKLTKIDFKSMYPSAIRSWNLGPDTTRILGIYDYTGKYKFDRTDKRLVIRFPDKNFDKDIEVEIDMFKTGFLKAEIEQLANERTRIKQAMKEAENKQDRDSLNSRQIAIKVILNSIYGYEGSPYGTFGDMTTAMVVTAMCRWTTQHVIDKVEDILVETDTDGLCVSVGEDDIDHVGLNTMLETIIKEQHGCDSYMELEPEPLEDGYFYKMKNYVVREIVKGKLVMVKHGVAFKSSRQAPVCDIIMDTIALKVLDRELEDQYEQAEQLKNINQYKLDKFKFRMTFSKDLEGYGERMCTQRVLGIQVQERLKIKVEANLQIEYYVTKEPPPCDKVSELFKEKNKVKGPYYTLSTYVTSIDQLDHNYYKAQMDRIFNIFEWDISPQLSFDFGDI